MMHSLLGTEQGHTLESPVDLWTHASWQVVVVGGGSTLATLLLGGLVWLEKHLRDQILVGSLWILVDDALEVVGGKCEWISLLVGLMPWSSIVSVQGDGSDEHNWEHLVELLS